MAKKKKYYYAIGRRKNATAIVHLYKGKGKIEVNNMPIADYFPGEINEYHYTRPFEVTDTTGKYHATIKVNGSGKKSQLEAVRLALSRALEEVNKEKFRDPLKDAGLLMVDSRVRERRKPNRGGRARAKKQSPKR